MNHHITLSAEHAYQLAQTKDFYESLTSAEQEVIRYAIKGYTNKIIAQQLQKSSKTIQNQIESITRKAREFYDEKKTFRHDILFDVMLLKFLTENSNVTL
jgi:DNA-binding CsgD family transcriptional regulator